MDSTAGPDKQKPSTLPRRDSGIPSSLDETSAPAAPVVADGSFAAICAQVNSGLDVRGLVEYIGWHPGKLVRSGDVYLALCPIHRDTIFRTLVLNPRNNTYHCKHVNCPGNRPSDFLDLLVKVSGRPMSDVLADLVKHFGAETFRLSARQRDALKTMTSTK